jgi:hypothetical protein
MILAENQNLHRQHRRAVQDALSTARFLAIFDFEQELKGSA